MGLNEDSETAIAERLKLRSVGAPVVRLSRGALIALVGTAGLGVAGAAAVGLANRPARAQPPQSYSMGAPPPASLAGLPKDYVAPKLGPALPGDLGRPILASQAAAPQVTPAPPAAASEAQQRAMQEVDAARTSKLFVTEVREAVEPASRPPGEADRLGSRGAGEIAVAAADDRESISPGRLVSPPSPYVLQAGTVIPAALVTGIRSDLPGAVIGQVTQNLFDSPTGRYLLVPQGAKLLGTYESQTSAGQSRVLLVWTRLILPNGRSLVLEKLPGGDAEGYSGLEDRVNHHWGAVAGAAALSTLLGVGVELGTNNTDSNVVSALRLGAASSLNQAGQQIVGKALTLPPTLTIRPGAPVRVLVNRDLVLEPYRD
jgi:type IV secretion system protein VirB10